MSGDHGRVLDLVSNNNLDSALTLVGLNMATKRRWLSRQGTDIGGCSSEEHESFGHSQIHCFPLALL
jgi:hypothetical protein